MSNTLILLAVLGVINFLIKKFATKPAVPANTQDENSGSPQFEPVSQKISQPTFQPTFQPTSAQAALEMAARKFADQARALGLVDENGNYISSRQSTTSGAPVAAKPKPARTPRVTQKPIGVTDFAPKVSANARSRAGQSATPPAGALPIGQFGIDFKITSSQTPKRPISAIDALVASRLSQRIAPITQAGRTANPMRIWNAKSMRQGMIMAEILSPPVALR